LPPRAKGKPLAATIAEVYDRIERRIDPALLITLRARAERPATAQPPAGG